MSISLISSCVVLNGIPAMFQAQRNLAGKVARLRAKALETRQERNTITQLYFFRSSAYVETHWYMGNE